MAGQTGRTEVLNVNHPGRTERVDARKYGAVREVMLEHVPAAAPGWTQAELRDGLVPHLPQDLWPGGAKAMWWIKLVQLDLEARGLLRRVPGKPLRWHRAPGGA
jgi:hypothetical protein